MENEKCAKCGSNHLMPNLKIPDSGGGVLRVIAGMNWAGFVTGSSTITATVCGECGYTELYTKDPQALWEEWSKKNT